MSDLVTWAEEMDKAGWPVLVNATLDERHRVSVYVYEDNAANRERVVANSKLSSSKESLDEGGVPDIWVSQKVVVSGDEEFATRLLQAK